jgi:enterochelin esterase-like enzyme
LSAAPHRATLLAMIHFLALLLALVATPALATTDDPSHLIPQVSAGRIVAWPALDGGAAGRMSVWVWLPPSYDAHRRQRYPVLYMHDGQNLFDRALTKFDQEWGIDEAVARMAHQGDLREWIVVGVQSPRSRYDVLFPAKLLPLLSPAFQSRVRNLDSGDPKGAFASAAYLDFLVHQVKARVDASFRTLPGREDTAVMGSSMGGLMAFYAMAEYPAVFGQAACVSMHVALASPTEKGADHKALATEVADAFDRYLATSRMRPGPNRLYIDHGSKTLDGSYGPYTDTLVPMLRRRGWTDGPNFEFRTFTGAEHNETAWRERVDIPLAFLDRKDP